MRYNPTERIGVNATENIFIKDLNWIFREQPIVDMGIDAFVEQVVNGDPKGKFLALQIKSGKGNFHLGSEKLTYYLSQVHFEYWTNFDIPIVMIAHIIDEEKTYWQEISRKKIRKTGSRWKLDIPKKNLLNAKAKKHLENLLSDKNNQSDLIKIFRGEELDENSIYSLESRIDLISDATESTNNTVLILDEFQKKVISSGEKFRQHNLRSETPNSPQFQNSLKSFAKDIILASRRLENEISIFSEAFGEGIYAFEQAITIHFNMIKNIIDLKDNLRVFETLSPALSSTIQEIQGMRVEFEKIPEDWRELKNAKTKSLTTIDLLQNEYIDAKQMTDNIVNQLRSRI
jgi:hypothetical protein